MRADLKALGDAVIEATRSQVTKAVAALTARLDALEHKQAAPVPDVGAMVREAVAAIPPPADGKDADPEVIRAAVAEAVSKAVAELPVPEDGKDADPEMIRKAIADAVAEMPVPEDGKDADMDVIRIMVANAVAELPEPKPGDPGKDADPEVIRTAIAAAVAAIPAPPPGKDADPEVIRAMVEAAVKELPKPKDGESPSAESIAALVMPELKAMFDAIPKPEDGKPGKSVTVDDFRQMFEAEQAKWALDFERRATDVLQRAIDKMPVPKNGLDGVDGLTIDDMTLDDDGDGNVTFRFARGDLRKEFTIRLPRFKDCGVFREGEYKAGDGVTFGGSFWLSQRDAPEGRPDSGNGHWRLAVKRGRDGKDVDPAPKAPVPVRLA